SYFIAFFILWTIRELWIVDFINQIDAAFWLTVVKAVIKILIWVVPVFLFVSLIEKENAVTYLGLRRNVKVGLKWAAWVSLALVIYFILQSLFILQNDANFDLGLDKWVNTIILVGFIEEVVFRGFILRKLMDQFQFWKANLITALLFLSIHFPIWFENGLFVSPAIFGTFVNVIIVS